jgi:hypothetical protein
VHALLVRIALLFREALKGESVGFRIDPSLLLAGSRIALLPHTEAIQAGDTNEPVRLDLC